MFPLSFIGVSLVVMSECIVEGGTLFSQTFISKAVVKFFSPLGEKPFSSVWIAGVGSLFSLASQAQEAAAGQPRPNIIESLAPVAFIIVVFYFFLIRPQGKRQKEHQKFLKELRRGDEIVTASGIMGKVEAITDSVVTLNIANGVNLRILRSQVAGSQKAMTTTAEGKA